MCDKPQCDGASDADRDGDIDVRLDLDIVAFVTCVTPDLAVVVFDLDVVRDFDFHGQCTVTAFR
jgi:hypothetical protein